jgi:hypothetical protein
MPECFRAEAEAAFLNSVNPSSTVDSQHTCGIHPPVRPPLLSEYDAADYLGRPVSTMRYWRTRGGGPNYLKVGRRIQYHQADLDFFLNGCRRSSTSVTG